MVATAVATSLVPVSSAAAPPSPSATAVRQHRWTICRSRPDEGGGRIPPSQWDSETHRQNCFLHRNDTVSAPGTALFQHWLSDSGPGGGGKEESWDPRSDFPTWEIMRQYPDIGEGDEARDYYTLWYTTEVDPPENVAQSDVADDGSVDAGGSWSNARRRRGHLTLHGVNYQPVVYFDGRLLQPYSTTPGDDSEQTAGGMFLRRKYDLGFWEDARSSSTLEVLVLPPPHVGKRTLLNSTEVDSKYGLEEGQGGDHTLAKSGAIMQFTAGWDWIQSTPDRNVGIWGGVDVEWNWGDVRLHDLHVKVWDISVAEERRDSKLDAALPLGDDVTVSAWLEISLAATLHQIECHQQNPVKGRIEYRIIPSFNVEGSDPLVSGIIDNVTLHQSVTEIHPGKIFLPNAKLWWPHTQSKRQRQPLYSILVRFLSDGGQEERAPYHEAQTQTIFGVRTVSSFVHPQTKSFALKVNGHPIFLTGGNWITTDQFLRYSESPRRYYHELGLMRHGGLNSIRVWGGGVAETEHFYNAADESGLLVYQEFWCTGDNNGRFAGSYDWPTDHDSYLANAEDTIKRLRNHPSLSWYGGGNEMNPIPSSDDQDEESKVSPPRDIEEALRAYIAEMDGTRPYITSSVTDAGDTFDNTRILAPKDGPYGMQAEEVFFNRNPGLASPLLSEEETKRNLKPSDIQDKASPGRNIGFQTEVGSVSHPELQSLKRFMSEEALNSYPDCGERLVYPPIHEEWTYWKYISFTEDSGIDHVCQFKFQPYQNNTSAQRMASVEDYTWAAQFAQYLQYKALFEGYSAKMWEWYSAVFHWKTSSPAPTFRGALYDWYLDTNGGYWGARTGLAGGSPLRVILNVRDWNVHVVNTMPLVFLATSVKWRAYSLNGDILAKGEVPIPAQSIQGNAVTHLGGSLPWVGPGKLVMLNHEVQDIVLYKLTLAYAYSDGAGGAGTATNSYFLTDPACNDDESKLSRFSLLGAMRKESATVKVDARCTMSTSGIGCELENSQNNGVAIMVKLALERNPPNEQKESRILPTFFSDNYITLLPGESVHVSVKSAETPNEDPLWKCSSDGFAKLSDSAVLMLSIDGWNVHKGKVRIACNPLSSLSSASEKTE